MKENILSVSQLNEYMHTLLRSDPVLCNLCVSGEVTGFKRHSSGHAYFSLKDEHALVRCVMFRQTAQALRFVPQDGMQVIIYGYAAFYIKDGQFQLYVQSMQKQGEGELYRRFLLLKTRLEAKGYFDQSHKKTIPFLPERVGVITSSSGAALQDILQIIRRRYPGMNIVIYPVQVQGAAAARQIAQAIRYMNRSSAASVLIVGRGGGSMEDLWAFNEECVAEAIYASRIPIISAVGHETDFTIADFTADLRAPTPSAAAELCVPDFALLAQQVDALYQRLPEALQRCLSYKKEKLNLLLRTRGFWAARHMIKLKRQILTNEANGLSNFMRAYALKKKSILSSLCMRLEALSPTQMLQRGYAFVTMENGDLIGGVSALRVKDAVSMHMHDGLAVACIEEIKNEVGKSDAGRKDV